jgi:hypothetical protein
MQIIDANKVGALALVPKESVDEIRTEQIGARATASLGLAEQLPPTKTKTFDSVSDFSSSSNSIDYRIGEVQQQL